MEPQYEKVIVLLIVFFASFATWKMVRDFYITKLPKVFTYLIAIVTASFMFLSATFLFVPQNYQGKTGQSDVELSLSGIIPLGIMLLTLYFFFKFISQDKK